MSGCGKCGAETVKPGYCAPCKRAYQAQWRKDHPGYATRKTREWYERNREAARAKERRKAKARYARKMKEIHGPDWVPRARIDLSGLTPEQRQERRRAQWNRSKRKQESDPVYRKARNAARHARTRTGGKSCDGRFGVSDVLRLLDEQRGACRFCAVPIRENYHVDHIVPLCKNGTNHASNIQLLCPSCNMRKGAKQTAS